MRDDRQAAVERITRTVAHGRTVSSSSLILGEAGIGKSWLLERAAAAARRMGSQVVTPLDAANSAVTPGRPVVLLADDSDAAFLPELLTGYPAGPGVPVTVLMAMRGDAVPAGLARHVRVERLGPMDDRDIATILDARPDAPRGWPRREIIRQARGNPGAAIALAGAEQGIPASYHLLVGELPEATRVLLLHAALWDTGPPPAELIAAAVPGCDLFSFAPAERAGLITIQGDAIVFRHPLIPVALRQSAGRAGRRRAHLRLSAVLGHDPGRLAWHLASAEDASAERAALFRRAASAQRGAEAARSWQRAAEDDRSAADFLSALELVDRVGDASWVGQLWSQIRLVSTDPRITAEAACFAAASMILTGEPDEAHATATAALAGIPAGDRLAARLESIAGMAAFCAGPAAGSDEMPRLHDEGVSAWLRDDTRTAVRRLRDPLGFGSPAGNGAYNALPLLLSLLDGGYWQEADVAAERVARSAALGAASALGAGAAIVQATLAAMRGDGGTARTLLRDAERSVDLSRNGLLRVLAYRARAHAASADGDYAAAAAAYAALFDRHGVPVSHWTADRVVGEYAVIAMRARDTGRVRAVIERMNARTGHAPRVRLALHLANGLIAEPGDAADEHLRIAAEDPAGAAWPAERAIARLHYASYLRRQRRFTEATPLLNEAMEDAQRFGAQVFARIVQSEMRANGATVEQAPNAKFTGLTAQQQHIVRLAAAGMRNREIAERLSMSERTVGSHLYHVYPKLGVTGRHQLRKVLEDAR